MFTVKEKIHSGLVSQGFAPKDAPALQASGRLVTNVEDVSPGFSTGVQHITAKVDGKEIVSMIYVTGDGGDVTVDLEL
jgi:hypothetical protein